MNKSSKKDDFEISLHPDLIIANNLIYKNFHLSCSNLIMEPESAEYGACSFHLNDLSIKFRVAKTTPTKTGQFVTIWERDGKGPIRPYDTSDTIDLFIISVRKENYFGQFIFPKVALSEQDVISVNKKGGKRGIRVYAPWDLTLNKQSQKTKKWQIEYFLDLSPNHPIDFARAKKLYLQG